MVVLSAVERARISRWFQRDPNLGQAAFTKPELVAAIAAADQWADDNAAAYNLALPVAFRTTATAGQKAMLLAYVIARRWGLNPIDGGD